MDISEIAEMTTKRIELDKVTQEREIDLAIAAARAEAAAHGMSNSSRAVLQIEGIYVAAIRDRVISVWETIKRYADAGGISYSPTLAEELKKLVRSYAPALPSESDWSVDQEAVRLGLFNMELYSRDNLPKAYTAAHAHVEAEIDHYVLALRKISRMSQPISQILNISDSTIANLQTGDGAIATVTQTVNNAHQLALIKALNDLKSELEALKNVTPQLKIDTLDLIEDSVKEAGKATPNKMKLLALTKAIGSTFEGAVTFAGKIPTAIETMKSAATALGLG